MVINRVQHLLSVRVITSVIALILLILAATFMNISKTSAAVGTNETINYQARLLTSTGATVPDGTYNIEFKIYQDGDGVLGGGDETLEWTETRTGSNRVVVKNGYFSVYLGSVTPFGTSIDWNQDTVWLSVNIGGTASPSYDGEMSPFIRFSSTPYALNSKYLGGLASSNFVQLANGVQADASTTNTSIFVNKTGGTANIMQLQRGGTDVLTITNSGQLTFKPNSDDANALRIQNATAGETLFSADTTVRGSGGGNVIKIGNSTGTDTATTILQVDSATADLTSNLAALNGGLFYNSTTNKLKVIENGIVKTLCNTTDAGCGAGGPTTLNSAYTAGSAGNQTITLSTANDSIIVTNPAASGTDSAFAFQINQNNTTAGAVALDLSQLSNNANGLNLAANSIDTETGLSITTNALTTGKGLTIDSSSTALTGSLAEITLSGSNAANTGSLLKLSNTGTNSASTGLYIDHRATGTGNLALRIDDQAGDTSPFIIDGDGRVGIGTNNITGTTERLLQVGSETNRGNASVYGELISKGLKSLKSLSNIRDIYVYDTTSDTDGGRWIDWATTDQLSWHNETLDDSPSVACDISTMDRCYSETFPRKAVIVATTDALYIFDGSNNTMWMKFSKNAGGFALGTATNNTISSVAAQNGVIYVGTNGTSAGGLYAIDFTQDRMWNYDTTDRSGADKGISDRNTAITYNSDNNTNFDLGTVGTVADWGRINDVSVAVIKNSSTGSSTIAGPNNGTVIVGLATDSGLTAINLSTQKLRQYSEATDNDYNSVAVTRSAKLYGLNETLGQAELWTGIDLDNVATRVNGAPEKFWDETSAPLLSKNAPTISANAPDALEIVERGSMADGGVAATATVASSSDIIYVGTNQGLTEINDHSIPARGWSKFFNRDRQTPFMPGTIRRMHPMDEASGNATNAARTSEMVANGSINYGVRGVRGTAMDFNGTNGYLCSGTVVTCATDANDASNTGSFNYTMWFKRDQGAVAGVESIFARCFTAAPAAATGCTAAAMNTAGQIVFTLDDDALWSIGAATNNDVTYTTNQAYNDGQWHFLSFSKINGATAPVAQIDGNVISHATSLTHTTMSGSQILGVGTSCSTGANCSTGGNLFNGAIDDFTYSACGTVGCNTDGFSTTSALAAPLQKRLFNDARPMLNRKVVKVTDATTATSTTIGDSAETWIPNEFSGLLITLTGGTGAEQTRRIVSNTTNTITVSPGFGTTPDTTTDFKVDPESLVGSSNTVTSVAVSGESAIGEARLMCAGTNDGADGGAVTCYNHNAGPNIVADAYHADAGRTDDTGASWTGTGSDNVQSMDISGRALVIGSGNLFWNETQDVRIGQAVDALNFKIFDIRNSILTLGNGLAGATGLEVGLTGGADLAENYTSEQPLEAGDIVALEPNNVGAVKKSTERYQKDTIGIVSTAPGAVLGPEGDTAYPIALVGRVPVKVTTENGPIKSGDRITSASTAGYGMKAVNGGRVAGTALDDLDESKATTCPAGIAEGVTCGVITVFVNLVDYSGSDISTAVNEAEAQGLLWGDSVLSPVSGIISWDTSLSNEQVAAKQGQLAKSDKILRYLAGRNINPNDKSEVLADSVSANQINGGKIYAKDIYAATLTVDKIKANQIEGLELLTDKISSLGARLASERATNSPAASGTPAAVDAETQLPADLSIQSAVVKLDLKVDGQLFANGGLKVYGPAEFRGNAMFYKVVTFMEKTVFNEDVSFVGRATFNNDAGGFAIIKKDKAEIEVKFEKPFEDVPIVTVNARDGQFVTYTYKDLDKNSFKIILKDPADKDTTFAWTALSIKEARSVHFDQNDIVRQR